jgi:hypothetical protein
VSSRWLVSACFDLAFFVAPAALAIVVLWLSPATLLARDDLPVWIWAAHHSRQWYVGIVAFDSDYAFTLTNVASHGLPYVALVWITLRKRWAASTSLSWLRWISSPRAIAGFVGLLIAFALLEEALWDWLVWGDHPAVFGGRNHSLGLSDSPFLAFVVALLALPQATHYVLDGFIWRTGPANPDGRRLVLELSPDASETMASPRARTARALESPSRGPSREAACS